jgi:NTP pyrophosphatase (non-canonical NTP hydrolase)
MTNYQELTRNFRLKEYDQLACAFGLLAEAGEIAACYQKFRRGDFLFEELKEKLHKELGDVMWHLSEMANDWGWDLDEIQKANIEKLTDRQKRNVIKGKGDER